jgi:hypothetical protein
LRNVFLVILVVCSITAGCITVAAGPEKPSSGANPVAGKPVINSFTASPASIQAGSPVIISWSISGATDIKIVPEIGPADKQISITVYPPASTDYTLTASNRLGSVSQTIRVEVAGTGQVTPGAGQPAVLPLVMQESGSLIKNMTSYVWTGAACAGDTGANLASRAFLSFDITSIPPVARITSVVLDLSNFAAAGSPTYTNSNWGNMGALDVYQYQYGPSIDNGRLAYDASAIRAGSLRLSDMTGSDLKLDVTNNGNGENTVEKLLAAGQSRCQFRVQFFTSTNWDGKADMLCMGGAVLRVKYTLP